MVEWKKSAAILVILSAFIVPMVLAALAPSFSDTVWQVPNMHADTYYLGPTTDITSALTTQEASYIVWASGGTYYALNGATGATTSNANIATLTQATMNAMTTGGYILFKTGEYHFPTRVTIPYVNM